MRAHLGNKHRDRFDIKADEGGITDINFITQYLVLRYAHEKPKLTRWSDNVRILELHWRKTTLWKSGSDGADPCLRRCAMNFIIWHYRNCRAMCRRIASPQSVNWCGQAGRSGWWKNEVWYRAQILNLSGDRNESNAARV